MRVVDDSSVVWLGESWTDTPAAANTTVGILRCPFDYAVSHRPGCRFGPDAIVAELNGMSTYVTDKRVELESLELHDLGSVEVSHSLADSYAAIRSAVAGVSRDVRLVALGGDHSIADPIVRGLVERHPGARIGIVAFDAHFDSRVPVPGKEHSGHWMHTIEDVVDYRACAQIGISAPIYSEHYMKDAESRGVLVRTPYELRRRGVGETIREVAEHVCAHADAVYVTVDIDCLDRSCAPGTSVPNSAGLLAHEVVDGVFELSAAVPTVCLDVNEVSPPLDPSGATAGVAATIVLNHLAGVYARRRLAG